MKEFISEFKAFAMRGNVVDLAVAVVIGGAFGKIVSSLVDNIFMPIIGIVMGGVDFSGYAYKAITYGKFIQSVIDFVIIALVIFLVVKAMTKMQKKEEAAPATSAEPSEEIKLLREIRDGLRR
jgi:large conductance mechanosensitive channel